MCIAIGLRSDQVTTGYLLIDVVPETVPNRCMTNLVGIQHDAIAGQNDQFGSILQQIRHRPEQTLIDLANQHPCSEIIFIQPGYHKDLRHGFNSRGNNNTGLTIDHELT